MQDGSNCVRAQETSQRSTLQRMLAAAMTELQRSFHYLQYEVILPFISP